VYFDLHEPSGPETPLVVEVPHAGLVVDAASSWTLAAPVRALAQDADLYVDELYADAPKHGATLIAAQLSRYVCDLNRSETDVDPIAVEGAPAGRAPHGPVWRSTTHGQPALYAPLPPAELNRRLESIYRPYHRALGEALARKKQRFGFAILLCGHSMPSTGRLASGAPGAVRADVVPGSRGGTTTSARVLQTIDATAEAWGFSVRHDDPYRGGYSTGHYGRPDRRLHAVQVELSRRLYMDEDGLKKKPSNFERCKDFCSSLVARLAELDLA
jgi:N-formylglutamate deformylase